MDKVVHFELPTDDMARAAKFYGDCFGWRLDETPFVGIPYFLATTVETDAKGLPRSPGAINGALMGRDAADRTTVITIKVQDMVASLARVVAAGGKVVMPARPVGPIGLFARFSDTEGNVVALWQDLPVKKEGV